ncbi:MAG TPA: 3-deoxy-manno-octulosonate cytidylyltransferase [Gemmatimonadales bacterium]|jgi:3-deoxy-manno-octulosonate cytidylyltransferase (CMP-KDO synthetase)|nr:3-deoxy-manno-octulosonate cytidylyltransferase [Gemmatimonadales bacterium]
MRTLGVIPARLGSTRIPNKPLQLLAGEPLVTRVIHRVRSLGLVDVLVVATDSSMVAQVAERSGVRAVLTDAGHRNGTERVAEVAERPEFREAELIANVQGDEPFLPGEALAGALRLVQAGFDIGTAAAPLVPEQAADPDRVKVVTDEKGRALYFSRAPIPWRREPGPEIAGLYWQHVGVYVYHREALRRWVALPPSPAEQAERLEQLRPLHHGLSIGVARLDAPVPPGVDTEADLRRAEAHWLAYAR